MLDSGLGGRYSLVENSNRTLKKSIAHSPCPSGKTYLLRYTYVCQLSPSSIFRESLPNNNQWLSSCDREDDSTKHGSKKDFIHTITHMCLGEPRVCIIKVCTYNIQQVAKVIFWMLPKVVNQYMKGVVKSGGHLNASRLMETVVPNVTRESSHIHISRFPNILQASQTNTRTLFKPQSRKYSIKGKLRNQTHNSHTQKNSI